MIGIGFVGGFIQVFYDLLEFRVVFTFDSFFVVVGRDSFRGGQCEELEAVCVEVELLVGSSGIVDGHSSCEFGGFS